MLDLFWLRGVAGSGSPRSYEDIKWLADQKIRAILTLTSTPLPDDWLVGFTTLHIPIIDFNAPTLDQYNTAVRFLDTSQADGRTPLVHCAMGYGRTGTILAAHLIIQGESTMDAIAEVRRARPGAIETQEQEFALFNFEAEVKTLDA
jgi:atypical dual specificity phosphatase